MLKELDDYNWQEAFKYANPKPIDILEEKDQAHLASFSREDVIEILSMEDGENDEASWVGLFKLKDGRYAYLEAGCDYTGWG